MKSAPRIQVFFAVALCLLTRLGRGAEATGVRSVALTVSDLERSVAFYTRVLSFHEVGEREIAGEPYEQLTGIFGLRARAALLTLGDEEVILVQYLTPGGRPLPGDSRPNDRWFQHMALAVSDMDKAYQWVHDRRAGFLSPNPQPVIGNPATEGVQSFYFRDPDNHALALVWYPEGKGDSRWHRENRAQKIFLGIDHTAVTVASTEKSLHFYRDLLGFKVQTESDHRGPAQERLVGIAGAQVKATRLAGTGGPGIELIEYLQPSGGRAYPADARPNDLLHWQTQVMTDDLDASTQTFEKAGTPFVSKGAVAFPERELGVSRALLMRDPDGHAIAVLEKRPGT